MKTFQVGQVVVLDCGYGGGPYDRECLILSVEQGHDLFGQPRTVGEVEIIGTGERFDAILAEK